MSVNSSLKDELDTRAILEQAMLEALKSLDNDISGLSFFCTEEESMVFEVAAA
mgnify:FL=1